MKVYLDNCCYNRPFDRQDNARVHLESLAKLELQERIRKGELDMVCSYVLDYEASRNPYKDRRESILPWISMASQIITGETAEIIRNHRYSKAFTR